MRTSTREVLGGNQSAIAIISCIIQLLSEGSFLLKNLRFALFPEYILQIKFLASRNNLIISSSNARFGFCTLPRFATIFLLSFHSDQHSSVHQYPPSPKRLIPPSWYLLAYAHSTFTQTRSVCSQKFFTTRSKVPNLKQMGSLWKALLDGFSTGIHLPLSQYVFVSRPDHPSSMPMLEAV